MRCGCPPSCRSRGTAAGSTLRQPAAPAQSMSKMRSAVAGTIMKKRSLAALTKLLGGPLKQAAGADQAPGASSPTTPKASGGAAATAAVHAGTGRGRR